MLPQTQLSSKQSFISQLGWKEVFFFTNSFDELSCHFSHIHKGKKKIKIHLPSIVSQLQRLRGRLPFPLAKTYEHKKKKKRAVLIKSGKKKPNQIRNLYQHELITHAQAELSCSEGADKDFN